jgi:hypothetical protein
MSQHHSFPSSYELHRWARRQRSAALANSFAAAFRSVARALTVRDHPEPGLDAFDAGIEHGPQHR